MLNLGLVFFFNRYYHRADYDNFIFMFVTNLVLNYKKNNIYNLLCFYEILSHNIIYYYNGISEIFYQDKLLNNLKYNV